MAVSRKRTVELEFIVDDSQVGRKLSNIEANTSKTSKAFSQVGFAVKAAVGSAAVRLVQQFADDAVRAFSELEQAAGGTEAVFGDASDAVDDFARKAATEMGLSEAEFRTATTSIGGQLKRMTGDVQLAADESIRLTGVAADLAATYGGTTAEAVQALGAAFRGEADPAERFNLDLKIGKQNAKAVELGLARTTAEVDDHARAQALLALITEQSADAQGQFARESDTVAGQTQITAARIENHKAVVGETLQAYRTWGNVMSLEVGKALASLAVGIQTLTGDLTEGEQALKNYEIATGDVVSDLDGLVRVIGEANREAEGIGFWQDIFDDTKESAARMTRDLPKLVEGLELTTEELQDAVANADSLAHQMGLTDEEARVFESTLRTQLSRALDETRENFGRSGGAAREWRDAQREATAAAEDHIDTLGLLADEQLALIDPMYNVIKRTGELDAAQQGYTEALIEHGPKSAEARQAALDLAEAEGQHQAAVEKLSEDGIPGAVASFEDLAREAGIAEETIRLIIDAILALNATEVTNPIVREGGGGGGGVMQFDHGGVVPGPRGSPRLILAHGGETVLPTHRKSPLEAFAAEFGSGGMPQTRTSSAGSVSGAPLAVFTGPVIGLENVERAIADIVTRARRKGIAV